MPQTKRASKRKYPKEAVPVLGVVGVSLSLAGGASAATAVPAADIPSWDTSPPQLTLSEEEIADVSLGTFYVFDKENAGMPRIGKKFAQRACGCSAPSTTTTTTTPAPTPAAPPPPGAANTCTWADRAFSEGAMFCIAPRTALTCK